MVNPVNDIATLNKRLDFLDFILDSKQRELVEDIRDNMRFLTSDLNVSKSNSVMWWKYILLVPSALLKLGNHYGKFISVCDRSYFSFLMMWPKYPTYRTVKIEVRAKSKTFRTTAQNGHSILWKISQNLDLAIRFCGHRRFVSLFFQETFMKTHLFRSS